MRTDETIMGQFPGRCAHIRLFWSPAHNLLFNFIIKINICYKKGGGMKTILSGLGLITLLFLSTYSGLLPVAAILEKLSIGAQAASGIGAFLFVSAVLFSGHQVKQGAPVRYGKRK